MLKHSYHARLSFWHVVLAVVLLAVALPLLATETAPERTLAQADRNMRSALDTFRPVLRQHPGYVVSLADEYLAPLVDMDTAARLALGRHWRSADASQRTRFREEFRRLLLRNYSLLLANHLQRHDMPRYRIVFRPVRTDTSENYRRLRSVFRIPHRADVPVDYALHRVHGQWRVYDVSIGGVSLLHTYRAVFESRLRSVALDDLIDQIARQNRRPVSAG